MDYKVDLHTHTVASGHAYTTLLENVEACAEKGIKVLGVSDHAPAMPGATHPFYFGNIKAIPRVIKGVTILRGCEANIMDYDGNIDLPEEFKNNVDYVIASLHDVVIQPGTVEENTNAILGAMDNEMVMIIGHSGNPYFPINAEEMVKKAKEKDIIIELNNSSLSGSRAGSEKNCFEIAKLCKKYNTKVIINSDAHFNHKIGEFQEILELIKELEIPEELFMNDENRIISFLKGKGKLQDL